MTHSTIASIVVSKIPFSRVSGGFTPQLCPIGAVEEITVMGPCSIAWRPPADNGGERPGYAIRFFDGATYGESSFKMIFRYFEDPDKMFITLEDCPTDRPIYADVCSQPFSSTAPLQTVLSICD